MNEKEFWAQQSSSFGRYDSPEFYSDKAEEHAQLLRIKDRVAGAVDLGCGAGELLEHLLHEVHIEAGVDYSSSMLEAAKKRIGKDSPELIKADVFQYLESATHPVWLTTGALNQYLKATQIEQLMALFHTNPKARSFYLFDCVDPIRYRLMGFGISFHPNQLTQDKVAWYRRIIRYLRRALVAFNLTFGRLSGDCVYMGSPAMGYGFSPRFWMELGKRHGISTRIVNSRHYEYRYHVIFNKD